MRQLKDLPPGKFWWDPVETMFFKIQDLPDGTVECFLIPKEEKHIFPGNKMVDDSIEGEVLGWGKIFPVKKI